MTERHFMKIFQIQVKLDSGAILSVQEFDGKISIKPGVSKGVIPTKDEIEKVKLLANSIFNKNYDLAEDN